MNGVVRHVQLLADVALGQVAVVAHEPPGDVQQGGVTARRPCSGCPCRTGGRGGGTGRRGGWRCARWPRLLRPWRCAGARRPCGWGPSCACRRTGCRRAPARPRRPAGPRFGDRVMSPPVWATITSAVRCPTRGMVTNRAIPEPIVRAALRCPVLRRTGSPGASRRFRRFKVDVEEFDPEVLDSPQKAVQGRLVGSGAPKHRGIARHAHLRVIEERPHPWTCGTANGDHVGAIGYLSITHHLRREPPDRVGCLHPFRVRRPALARAGMTRIPSPGQASDETFGPSTSEPAVIGS